MNPEPYKSSSHHPAIFHQDPLYIILIIFLQDPFCIILYLHLVFSHQNTICILFLSHMYHMPIPSHASWFHCNNIRQAVQIMKLLITPFPPTTCFFQPLGSKYPSQYPVLKYPHCMFFHSYKSSHFTHKFKTRGKISFFKFKSWHFQRVHGKSQNILHGRQQAYSYLIFF